MRLPSSGRGAYQQLFFMVAIKARGACDRRAKARICIYADAWQSVAQFFCGLYGAVGIHQVHKDGPPVVVRGRGPYCNVRRAVIIKVAQSGNRRPIAAGGAAVLYVFLDAAIGVQKQHVYRVSARAYCNVGIAVAVEIAYAGNRRAKVMAAAKPGALCSTVVYLRVPLYRTVVPHEKYVHSPAGRPSPVSPRILKAHCDVRHAVAVEIAYAGDGVSKVALITCPLIFAGDKGQSVAYRRPMVYSLGGFFCTVVIQKHYEDHSILVRAASRAGRGNVGYSVAVYVPNSCNRAPQLWRVGASVSGNPKVACAKRLGLGLYRAIRIHEKYVNVPRNG